MANSRPISSDAQGGVLTLNNLNAAELSLLDTDRLAHLVRQAYLARVVGDDDDAPEAFLVTFDETADYDSPNFLWFRERYGRFAYVDRVAVSESARGRGLARRLYEELFAAARADGHSMVACEVNLDPPNPGSDAFHAALGFRQVGQGGYGGRTVRYFVREL